MEGIPIVAVYDFPASISNLFLEFFNSRYFQFVDFFFGQTSH